MSPRSKDREGIFQGRLFGGSERVGKVVSREKEYEANKGTHIVTNGKAIYFSSSPDAPCWMTSTRAYCDFIGMVRSGLSRIAKIKLREDLKIYRDKEHDTVHAGAVLYIHPSNLPKNPKA